MKLLNRVLTVGAMLGFSAGAAYAGDAYSSAISAFKNAGQSATFFKKNYGYAVFPTVGEGALGVGAAHGNGRMYVHGKWVGDVSLTQVSVGFQAGGKAFSQIIFFEDKRAADEFESGSFEFGADAGVVAVTAGASASASTTGAGAGASGSMKEAVTRGEYYKGMAVFTIAKGGLMYQASISGEKFTYKPRHGE
ncbi:MAG: lipid-binding SYLF domain-containing protein [Steroidobacteraceae bacterium]